MVCSSSTSNPSSASRRRSFRSSTKVASASKGLGGQTAAAGRFTPCFRCPWRSLLPCLGHKSSELSLSHIAQNVNESVGEGNQNRLRPSDCHHDLRQRGAARLPTLAAPHLPLLSQLLPLPFLALQLWDRPWRPPAQPKRRPDRFGDAMRTARPAGAPSRWTAGCAAAAAARACAFPSRSSTAICG